MHANYKRSHIRDDIFSDFSKKERALLRVLGSVCDKIADIYSKQEAGNRHASNFYPEKISDRIIESRAKKDPRIFSPYSVVIEKKGKLLAIPYHKFFRSELMDVAKLLVEAGTLADNKQLSNYLSVAASSLISGNYQQMDKAWLKTTSSKIIFLIGPYERNLDQRFFTKMAYLSFLGILDEENTKRARKLKEVFFTNVRNIKPHRYTYLSKLDLLSVRDIVSSGFLAQALISTEHIPSDDLTINKYGSRLIGYLSTMDYKFEKLLYPIFLSVFESSFQKIYSKSLLKKALYYLLLSYGLTRQIHRYEGSRDRLKELFPSLDEANSMVSGIRHSKYLVLKGVIDQSMIEAMIIMHICWIFSEWIYAKSSDLRKAYLQGDALALNFYFREKALHEAQGLSWPNFSKIFFTIEYLSKSLIRLLSEGSHEEAKDFISKNLSFGLFEMFDKKLSEVKTLS